MKRKIIPSLLFAICGGLAAGWVTLQQEPRRQMGKAWEAFKFEDIKAVHYQSPALKVDLTPLSLKYGWLEYAESGKEPRVFLTGPQTKDLWFNLSPLWASKVLGDSTDLGLTDFALDQHNKLFQVDLREGKSFLYEIGGRGFQSTDLFVWDKARTKIFLWDRQTINTLEDAPQKLALEKLDFVLPDNLHKVILTLDGKTRTIEREGKEWREGGATLSKDDPLPKALADMGKLPAGGYRKNLEIATPLLKLSLEGDNVWNLVLLKDPQTKQFLLRFADDRPLMVFDEAPFAPLFEELRLGINPAKN